MIALIPAVVVSVVFYGLAELLVLAVSVISCVALEYLITKYLLKAPSTVGDWSAAVTGILPRHLGGLCSSALSSPSESQR